MFQISWFILTFKIINTFYFYCKEMTSSVKKELCIINVNEDS